jgi:predicted anti-sigma-YlaC factor YlaD
MSTDRHESICHLIDKSLADKISAQEEQSLRQHLSACAACRRYLDTSNRAIASLGGFAFETDPGLPDRITAALTVRAAQLETRQMSHRQLAWSYVAALILTLAGSFVAMQLGGRAAAAFSLTPQQIHSALIALWIVPSVCFCLLLPTLPLLSKKWLHPQGVSL